MVARLEVARSQILAFRRRMAALDRRLAPGRRSLRLAAWAGLQDSMPRAALLSLHARVRSIRPTALEDPYLIQVWGPRYSVYVVPAPDVAVFTLGRLSDDPVKRRDAYVLADRLEALLDGRRMLMGELGRALGRHSNWLRLAAPTGRLLIHWDGARQPTIWMVPPPEVDPETARREMARRYLHVFGPASAESFAEWAGISAKAGSATLQSLRRSLTPVATPIGEGWILSRDEAELRADTEIPAPARLLPSGDTYSLLQGLDRQLLVPDAAHRGLLWTPRVWPGAVLVDGEIVGVWRRAREVVTVQPWARLPKKARDEVEREAASLPLPGVDREIVVRWEAGPR
ncbi:MAG TPA: crosslink repair DNA glycosylase YcaQ family protein [Acidimicrobiia bacterium]|nr:crosslink repair DNA glycosylase YcaQ family protein [Acidimicrobiia bacterium]